MNAIVRCKLRFTPPPEVVGVKSIIISPLPYPQQLPDWIKKAAGYDLAIQGDHPVIVEVEVKKSAPKEYVESKKAAEGVASPGGPEQEPEGREEKPKAKSSK